MSFNRFFDHSWSLIIFPEKTSFVLDFQVQWKDKPWSDISVQRVGRSALRCVHQKEASMGKKGMESNASNASAKASATIFLHPRSSTWNLRIRVSNKNRLCQGLIFRWTIVKLLGVHPCFLAKNAKQPPWDLSQSDDSPRECHVSESGIKGLKLTRTITGTHTEVLSLRGGNRCHKLEARDRMVCCYSNPVATYQAWGKNAHPAKSMILMFLVARFHHTLYKQYAAAAWFKRPDALGSCTNLENFSAHKPSLWYVPW